MKSLYFILGTQAELMKMYRVIRLAQERGFACYIIATGQNVLEGSPFLEKANAKVDLNISAQKGKEKTAGGYFGWLLGTAKNGRKMLAEYFTAERRADALCVVHGDTLTSALGAWLCKSLKLPYAHVESGPRSFHFLSPFPEEFDRLYASSHSVMNFCPGAVHAEYAAKRFHGKAIDTTYNTGIETLFDAVEENAGAPHPDQPDQPYFMFMLHRQENIMNRTFVTKAVTCISHMADQMACVFIYHDQTRQQMEKFGVFDLLKNHPNIHTMERQNYTNFIRLVEHAEFIATDGCGNQQEFYYLGKPYLILRTAVEKNTEGLGYNAKPFGGDFEAAENFVWEYHQYTKPRVIPEVSPSHVIVNAFEEWFASSQK